MIQLMWYAVNTSTLYTHAYDLFIYLNQKIFVLPVCGKQFLLVQILEGEGGGGGLEKATELSTSYTYEKEFLTLRRPVK